MTDANLERITILLQARDRDFVRAMDRSNKLIARLSREGQRDTTQLQRTVSSRLDEMGASAAEFGRNLAAGLAGGAAAAAFGFLANGLRQTVTGIAAVGDQARRAGVSIEAFQEWAFVANQNRIGVDQLVDGLKELSLRADEFVVTGAGPAAEAFARLGYDAASLREGLQDPSELLLEIIGRMQALDSAAQIRVADEVFGGSAGERFVELLSQGEAGLRRTLDMAHEVGAVSSGEMIAQADQIDRRFGQLAETLARLGREAIVGWSYLIEDAFEAATIDDAEQAAADLQQRYQWLAEGARGLEHDIINMALAAQQLGHSDLSSALAALAAQMVAVTDQFGLGEIGAEALQVELASLLGAAETAASAMQSMDGVNLDNALSVISTLQSQLAALGQQASVTAAQVAAATITPARQIGSFWDTEEGRFDMTGQAPARSPRPRAAPPLLGEPELPPPPPPEGGGFSSRFADAVADIEARTRALNIEAAAFVASAAGGRQYGDAVEYARIRAELLTAAQEEGREITPELTAEIEALAEAQLAAARGADAAREALERVREDAARGADAIGSIFEAMTQGGDAARSAISRLLQQIASAQFQRALAALAGGSSGGGFLSFIGGLLGGGGLKSFDGGGYTGNGARVGGVDGKGGFPAILHPQEVVVDRARGQAAPGGGSLSIGFDASMGAFVATMRSETGAIVAQAVRQIDAELPSRIQRYAADPRRR